MGYALYDTPMGEAGYGIEDTCNETLCVTPIDRGLAYLCGSTPGRADEYGCGRWFCEEHLWMPPEHVKIVGGGLCGSCMKYHSWLVETEDGLQYQEDVLE